LFALHHFPIFVKLIMPQTGVGRTLCPVTLRSQKMKTETTIEIQTALADLGFALMAVYGLLAILSLALMVIPAFFNSNR
jgi:hypothetical protein